MKRFVWFLFVCLFCIAKAESYSVLTHKAIIDSAWESNIAPLLKKKFPGTPEDQIFNSRKFSYGGSLIQDLGYYPGGNKFFSDLVHYVRSGDFVITLIEEATTVEEYAFALGALSHYCSDNIGHSTATNLSVPILYPSLRKKYGDVITYEEKPSAHLKVEFAYDVVQAARGKYLSEDFQNFIGFEVSAPVLRRSFEKVYGLKIEEIFPDFDTAIGTYRYTVTSLVPRMTKVAWELKKDDIEKLGMTREQFSFHMTPADFRKTYGPKYKKPGFFTKVLAFIVRILPPIGPFKILKFEPPTPEVEAMFLKSYEASMTNYLGLLRKISTGKIDLANKDLDTGEPTRPGQYRLTDKTYFEWIEKLSKKNFEVVTPDMKRNIQVFYAGLLQVQEPKQGSKKMKQLQQRLQVLTASPVNVRLCNEADDRQARFF